MTQFSSLSAPFLAARSISLPCLMPALPLPSSRSMRQHAEAVLLQVPTMRQRQTASRSQVSRQLAQCQMTAYLPQCTWRLIRGLPASQSCSLAGQAADTQSAAQRSTIPPSRLGSAGPSLQMVRLQQAPCNVSERHLTAPVLCAAQIWRLYHSIAFVTRNAEVSSRSSLLSQQLCALHQRQQPADDCLLSQRLFSLYPTAPDGCLCCRSSYLAAR